MKKTKKVISCFLLLAPLALPAACSPVSTASSSGSQERSGSDDQAEQLRIVIERYLKQQAEEQAKAAAARPAPPPVAAAVAPVEQPQEDEAERLRIAVEEYLQQEENVLAADGKAPAESEEELKNELSALAKTGDWSADESQVQCGIGPVAANVAVAKIKNAKKDGCEFPVVVNRQVQFYLDLFQGGQRKNFRRWLERSSRYLPLISQAMHEAGLPEELAYLAMIESGFNPSAYSPSHASGLWQFIPGTARNYGLRVDSWLDERRDPEKATKAAVSYLKALRKRFDNWPLAVAAYNAGEGAVERGLRKHKARTFWELAQHGHLRLETKRYVPQLMAAVIIARNPEQYGFSKLRQERPLRYDLVKVPAGTPLSAVAASASLSLDELRFLNNELLKDQTPAAAKGGYALKVPVGRSGLVAANLPKNRPAPVTAAADFATHKVAKNETLKEISRTYSVSMTDLLKVNDLRSAKLKAGQSLRIPPSGAARLALLNKGQDSKAKRQPAVSANLAAAADAAVERKPIMHKMGQGETLGAVGKKYKVSAAAIMSWNKIADARKVKAGKQLVIYPQQSAEAELSKAAVAAAPAPSSAAGTVELAAAGRKQRADAGIQAAATAPAASAPAVAAASAAKTAEVSYYHVRSGDSLWSIAHKLQVSAKEIRSWNKLIGNLLRPGLKLVIKNG